ncbi:MAG: hypothetical protein FWE04_02845 [Oscillospiraceae bacterium]|nr:hypothetical protein [Oscillospiraceae bacterium]
MPAKKKVEKKENEVFTYKGKPLLRCENVLYYGNPEDKYIARFTVESSDDVMGLPVASRVTIDLMTNEGEERSKIIKQAERDGLYKALDIGCFWLEDALEHF